MVRQLVEENRRLFPGVSQGTTSLSLALLLILVGCNKLSPAPQQDAGPKQTATHASTATTPRVPSRGFTEKIKFKSGAEATAFSLRPMDDGAKLIDSNEQEIARYNLSGNKLKVKSPEDKVLGYVTTSDGSFKIKDSEQAVELWQFQVQDDGDWKLEDGNDKIVYKIKKREYGFEIEDDADNSLFKVKLKDGKTSLRDPSEKTIYYTKDTVSTLAVTCLGLEKIESLELQVGLMTMLLLDSD